MTLTRRNFEELGLPAGPYTHAVTHGSTLYTSGLTAFGTRAQAGTAGEQTKSVLDQFEFIAEKHSASLQDLVKVTIFATDPVDIPAIRETLEARYEDNVPASSLVLISKLFDPDLRLEMEAIFALRSNRAEMQHRIENETAS